MKILIDECLPKRIKSFLTDFNVFTTEEMGWASLENGELLKAAIADDFKILLTADKNLEYQQNIKSLNISVVVFEVYKNKVENIAPLIPELLKNIHNYQSGKVYYIKETT